MKVGRRGGRRQEGAGPGWTTEPGWLSAGREACPAEHPGSGKRLVLARPWEALTCRQGALISAPPGQVARPTRDLHQGSFAFRGHHWW